MTDTDESVRSSHHEWRIDYDNARIEVGDAAIELLDEDGEKMEIDHASADDGYVAFLEAGEHGVKPGGAEATVIIRGDV